MKKGQSKTAVKKRVDDIKMKLEGVIESLNLPFKKKVTGFDVTFRTRVLSVYFDRESKSVIVLDPSTGRELYTSKFLGGIKNFFGSASNQNSDPKGIEIASKEKTSKKTGRFQKNPKSKVEPTRLTKIHQRTKVERRIELNKPIIDEPVTPKLILQAKEAVELVTIKDGTNSKPIEGFLGVKNIPKDRVVSIVSETYNFLPNNLVVDPILEFLANKGIKYKLDRFSYVTDQQMRLHLTFPDLVIKDDTKQGILSSVFVHNSYNMIESFRLVAGCMRQVCSNGMVIGEIVKKVKVVHRASRIQEIAVAQIESVINGFYKNTKKIEERIQELIAEKATGALLIKIARSVEGKTFSQLMRTIGLADEETFNRDIVRSVKDIDPQLALAQNYWVIYNILTDYISHYVAQRYRVDYLRRLSGVFKI